MNKKNNKKIAKIIVKIKKPNKEIEVEIPEIIHTPFVKKFGKLINHNTRVRLAKLLVKPVTWLYTEIIEEL